jgi:hypothetical protein
LWIFVFVIKDIVERRIKGCCGLWYIGDGRGREKFVFSDGHGVR